MAHRNSPQEIFREDAADAKEAGRRNRPADSAHGHSLRLMRGGAASSEKPLVLRTREDVVGVLVSAAADLLLRRISPVRAHEIEKRACRILRMFGEAEAEEGAPDSAEVSGGKSSGSLLQRELRQLAAICQEGRQKGRPHRRR